MRCIALSLMRGVRWLVWHGTPYPMRMRTIERDYIDIPDVVHRLLPDPPHGAAPAQIQRKLLEEGYIGGCVDILDVRKVLWYLERKKRVRKFFELKGGKSFPVFLRLAS